MATEPTQEQEPEYVASRMLDSHVIARIKKSRKSAIPNGVPGAHYIVGIFGIDDNVEREFEDVTDRQNAEAFLFATQVARSLSESLEFNRSGIYRIVQNSQGTATRKNYHLHMIVLGLNLTEINEFGWEIRRLIDLDSFLIRKESEAKL